MSKETNQPDWTIVSQADVARATKPNAKKAKAAAALVALRKLKAGDAIRVALPEDNLYKANALRYWWRDKMKFVSMQEKIIRAFVSITSSDGKLFFIQRNPIQKSFEILEV